MARALPLTTTLTRVALLQDGTEVARQAYADVASCFDHACGLLSEQREHVELESFTDEGVRYFLDGVTPAEYDCVVLASNALLSEPVRRALQEGIADLHAYASEGGGLIVLHQLVDDVGWLLPYGEPVPLHDRTAPKEAILIADDADDALLWFPSEINSRDLRDSGHQEGPRRLYWRAFRPASVEARMKPVLRCGADDAVLARSVTRAQENIVISTIPADWHKRVDLLANMIWYGIAGKPDRIVWRPSKDTRDRPLERQISATSSSAFGVLPELQEAMSGTDAWLLRQVRYCIVSSRDDLRRLAETESVQNFIGQGGTILAMERSDAASTRIEAVLGGQLERSAVPAHYAELHALDDWKTPAYAFELRNIMSFLHMAWQNHQDHRLAIDPKVLGDLVDDVWARLAHPVHREDFGSCIALAQTLGYADVDPEELLGATDWMVGEARGRPRDVQAQVAAIGIAAGRDDPTNWDRIATKALDDSTLAGAARIADATAYISAVLPEHEAVDLRRLAKAFVTRLSAEDQSFWLSTEATADIARGLLCLRAYIRSDEALDRLVTAHIAGAQTVLRSSLVRYERNAKGVAWRSRVIEALVRIDRASPPGLERLEPLVKGSTPAESASTANEGLARHLTDVNIRLRSEIEQLRPDAKAARFGRLFANVLVGIVIVALAGFVASRLIGDSVSAVFGAIGAALLAFFVLTVAMAALLDRGGLLYPWAEGPYEQARDRVLRALFLKAS